MKSVGTQMSSTETFDGLVTLKLCKSFEEIKIEKMKYYIFLKILLRYLVEIASLKILLGQHTEDINLAIVVKNTLKTNEY